MRNILDIDLLHPDDETIERVADVLTSGGIVIYPTDTAYGIGVNGLDEKAIRKLYEIKGRSYTKPTHVVVRDWAMIDGLCIVDGNAKKLYDKFMPGALTMILEKKDKVPDVLTAHMPTLGVRVPDCFVTMALSKILPFPYTTSSANASGAKTPYSIEDVGMSLNLNEIDLILDAGILPPTPPSTVVDLSKFKPEILREGPITNDEIECLLG